MSEKLSIKNQLEEDGFLIRPTVGNSMEPLLFDQRSLIRVDRIDGELKKGDVALYKRPFGKFVLHRVVKVREKDYIIIGDNRHKIEKVPKDWIIGVMTEYATDGNTWHTVSDEEYQKYVSKKLKFFWLRYYLRLAMDFPRRCIRKLGRMLRRNK